jgi:hypothetical protein
MLTRTIESTLQATSSPPRPARWTGVAVEQREGRRPRLKKRTEPPACQPARSPLPSLPRPAERGEEDEADIASTPPAPRTRVDEAELRLPPDPPVARLLPLLPSPPRPAGERRRKTGMAGAREQQTVENLLEGVVATSSTFCSYQRSQRAAMVSPTAQISPGSRRPQPGRAPNLRYSGRHLLLSSTKGSAPLLRLPQLVTPVRLASDRPGSLASTLKAL